MRGPWELAMSYARLGLELPYLECPKVENIGKRTDEMAAPEACFTLLHNHL
jgi:hypothetical protein